MTISSTVTRVNYVGNSVTDDFSFPYKFSANSDLIVYVADVLQVITTNYTVTGAGLDAGGTVTFLVAPPAGNSVIIIRSPALTQGLDLVENDPLPAESVENAFDKLTMIAQRLSDKAGRSFVLSDSAVSTVNLDIPAPVSDEVLKWNTAGDALESKTMASIGAVTIPVPIDQGGTGATSIVTAQQALDLEVGVDVQVYDADTAKTDVVQTFTASQRGTVTTDNDGSFDQSVTNIFFCTPSGAVALTFTNHTAGQSGLILFVNSSNYAITAAATTYIAAADKTKLSATGTYIIAYISNGTNTYCTVSAALTSAGA